KSVKRKTTAAKRSRLTAKTARRKKVAAKKTPAGKKRGTPKAAKPKSRPLKEIAAKKVAAPRRATAAAPAAAVSLLDDLIARARKAGADAADAVLVDRAALSVAQRLGQAGKAGAGRAPRR